MAGGSDSGMCSLTVPLPWAGPRTFIFASFAGPVFCRLPRPQRIGPAV